MNILKRNKKPFKKSITCLLLSLSLFCLSSAARMSKCREGFSPLPSFLSYKEATFIVQRYSIKTQQAFHNLFERDPVAPHQIRLKDSFKKRYPLLQFIPSDPESYYQYKGWASWSDFLGHKHKPADFLNHEKASDIVKSLNINYPQEFLALKRSNDPRLQKIPPNPDLFYIYTGWTNWFDFLGSKPPATKGLRRLLPRYTDIFTASLIAQRLSIKDQQMFEYLKDKEDSPLKYIPSDPESYYKDKGWTNWSDFLGTEQPAIFMELDEASLFIQRLRPFISPEMSKSLRKELFLNTPPYQGIPILNQQIFKHLKEHEHSELKFIPPDPESYYKDKWISWHVFLGTKKPETYFMSHKDASLIVQSLSLQSIQEFLNLKKQNDPRLYRIPSNPDDVYRGLGWTNWYNFLGIKESQASYKDASLIAKRLQIRDIQTLINLKEQNDERVQLIPSDFIFSYRHTGEWIDEYKFLGTIKPADYELASRITQSIPIYNKTEFIDLKKRNDERLQTIPPNPEDFYQYSGWTSWSDFLGTSKFMSYEEATTIVQKLSLKTLEEFINLKQLVEQALHSDNKKRKLFDEGTLYYENLDEQQLEELLEKQQKEADQYLKNKIIDQHNRFHSNLYKVLDDKRGIEWLKETLPYIPLAPHRVYKDEGFSWDGFFGSY